MSSGKTPPVEITGKPPKKVKSKKKKNNAAKGKEKKKSELKTPNRIIVRHLPPTMTEAEFLHQVHPLPDFDDFYYAPADWSLGRDATCRAYFTLKNYDDICMFRDRFDGYVFVDCKGAEYPAIVEFAPFQGLKTKKTRNDVSKINTIEEEDDYKRFVEKLNKEREATAKSGKGFTEFPLNQKKEKITTTPLLEFLKTQKTSKSDKKERKKTINANPPKSNVEPGGRQLEKKETQKQQQQTQQKQKQEKQKQEKQQQKQEKQPQKQEKQQQKKEKQQPQEQEKQQTQQKEETQPKQNKKRKKNKSKKTESKNE